jgi:glycosyltransferase involved in cell wall biosynthesis
VAQNKIKVMHVIGRLDVGGAEEFLLITAKFNLKEKYRLIFVSCQGGGYISRQIESLGYPVFELNLSNRVYDLRIIPRLVKIFKEHKPQVVHFYSKISLNGIIAARIAKVPTIICNHIDMWGSWGIGLACAGYIFRGLTIFADKMIACSEAVNKFWHKNKTQRHMVMYLPFDTTMSLPKKSVLNDKNFKNNEYPVIGTVSRINSGKGLEELIVGMQNIITAFPSAKLLIVGTGPLFKDLKNFVEKRNLRGSVIFAGFVENLSDVFESMDVFVLPSLTEGFPLVIIEAMAAGLPVAASSVGGIPEMIKDKHNGRLFPPKNPEAIADAVINLLSDHHNRRKIAREGKKNVYYKYSPQRYMKKMDVLYRDLVDQKKN